MSLIELYSDNIQAGSHVLTDEKPPPFVFIIPDRLLVFQFQNLALLINLCYYNSSVVIIFRLYISFSYEYIYKTIRVYIVLEIKK